MLWLQSKWLRMILGHEYADTANWYMSVNLDGVGGLSGSLGPLPMEEESDSDM